MILKFNKFKFKNLIFRNLLKENKKARVVVIVPTVPLVAQQASIFFVEDFMRQGYNIQTFSSENPLPSPLWSQVLATIHVTVMTPQILLNLLEENTASFNQLDLLVSQSAHYNLKFK